MQLIKFTLYGSPIWINPAYIVAITDVTYYPDMTKICTSSNSSNPQWGRKKELFSNTTECIYVDGNPEQTLLRLSAIDPFTLPQPFASAPVLLSTLQSLLLKLEQYPFYTQTFIGLDAIRSAIALAMSERSDAPLLLTEASQPATPPPSDPALPTLQSACFKLLSAVEFITGQSDSGRLTHIERLHLDHDGILAQAHAALNQ